jgi:tRNA threonylcarbamoyladenosine biosynthesis protein TsaB
MRLLALSTSTHRGTAALFEDGRLVGTAAYDDLTAHAERIFAVIDRVLGSLPRSSIDAFACDMGPGSFTGVRVGVSLAKGMALVRGAPLVGVVSLEAMASAAFGAGCAGQGDMVLSVIDAKKDELFLAAYGAALEELLPPSHVPRVEAGAIVASLVAKGRRLVVAGEVALGLEDLSPLLCRGEGLDLPEATAVGRLAFERLLRGEGVDAALIEPMYVRAPDAKPMASAT